MCTHCGEWLFPRPEPEEEPAYPTPEDEELHAATVTWFKSLGVSLVALSALTLGGVNTYTHWPVKEPPLVLPTPTPSAESETPTADPLDQLTAINTLLESIKHTRAKVPDTLGSCTNLASDEASLEEVVQERDEQASQAPALAADSLSDGESLKEALLNMVQSTLTADQKYLTWARKGESVGCTGVPATGTINDANQTAADAKRAFVGLWNSDAEPYDLPSYKWNDF
ncbi:hypothetical protein [Actinomadura sp. DC4]|uniref:hypothetical protein n=1 Tax=Actinomadura sp. DC4 TaxID=3055069 RepID=UPI0025B19575|nr:hypothetical protein [Actinomadura sp. DC4]MDN3351702.1 hypothetical protein [Actinomadura sp. DC4]